MQVWHPEDIVREWERDTCKVVKDQVGQEFRNRLMDLKERHLEVQEWQTSLVTSAVKAMEKDCWGLDTVLVLALTFMLPCLWPQPHLPSATNCHPEAGPPVGLG